MCRKKKTSSSKGSASLSFSIQKKGKKELPIVKTDNDVLRGRASHEHKDHHPGNVYLHELVSKKYDEYHDPNHPGNAWFHREQKEEHSSSNSIADTNEDIRDHDRKNRISRNIVEQIRRQGGRFLTRNKKDQPWQQVKNPVTIVSQTFRDYKEKQRRRHRNLYKSSNNSSDDDVEQQQQLTGAPELLQSNNTTTTTSVHPKKRSRTEDVEIRRKKKPSNMPRIKKEGGMMDDDGAEAAEALMSLGRLHVPPSTTTIDSSSDQS